MKRFPNDFGKMATLLEVSSRGLVLRIKELGLGGKKNT